jgi:hypothetical protein
MTLERTILALMAFIVVLSLWAYIDRDKPTKKRDYELDEARRYEAESEDDV